MLDFLSRLARVLDRDGSSYEYTYDAQNNITRLYHTIGQYSSTTHYTYDKDDRELTCVMNSQKHTIAYDEFGKLKNADPGNHNSLCDLL